MKHSLTPMNMLVIFNRKLELRIHVELLVSKKLINVIYFMDTSSARKSRQFYEN